MSNNGAEMIGDVTEAQFHANNQLINKTFNDVNNGKIRAQFGFSTMVRLAGKLNAHLFQCHIAHVNRGIVNATYQALRDTIKNHDPAKPEITITNIQTVLDFLEQRVSLLKEDLTNAPPHQG